MDILFLLGRLMYGGYFIYSGIMHFVKLDSLTVYANSKETPFPKYAVIISGLLIIFGGLGIALGIFINLSVALISLFIIPVSFIMHNFWSVALRQQRNHDMMSFFKNMALLGAAFIMLHVPHPWPYSLENFLN